MKTKAGARFLTRNSKMMTEIIKSNEKLAEDLQKADPKDLETISNLIYFYKANMETYSKLQGEVTALIGIEQHIPTQESVANPRSKK